MSQGLNSLILNTTLSKKSHRLKIRRLSNKMRRMITKMVKIIETNGKSPEEIRTIMNTLDALQSGYPNTNDFTSDYIHIQLKTFLALFDINSGNFYSVCNDAKPGKYPNLDDFLDAAGLEFLVGVDSVIEKRKENVEYYDKQEDKLGKFEVTHYSLPSVHDDGYLYLGTSGVNNLGATIFGHYHVEFEIVKTMGEQFTLDITLSGKYGSGGGGLGAFC